MKHLPAWYLSDGFLRWVQAMAENRRLTILPMDLSCG